MRNTVSVSTGAIAATSRNPYELAWASWPSTTMPHDAPGTCDCFTKSMKRRSTSVNPDASLARSLWAPSDAAIQSTVATKEMVRSMRLLFSLAPGPHPRRELTQTRRRGFTVRVGVWPQALFTGAGAHGHPNAAAALGTPPVRRELTQTRRRGFTVRVGVWPQAPRSLTLIFCRISKFQHSRLRPVNGALRQPLQRRAEHQEMIAFPHRVVRRAGKVDEHLVPGAEIGVELAH